MRLEIFALCDSASDYGGRLCLLGVHDQIRAKEAPIQIGHCALAVRMRFHRIEDGRHKLVATISDEDGKNVVPKIEADMLVNLPESAQSAAVNLVLAINGLKLPSFGEYSIDLAIDGAHQGSLPIYCPPPPKPEIA
jgi:hypothetical protein